MSSRTSVRTWSIVQLLKTYGAQSSEMANKKQIVYSPHIRLQARFCATTVRHSLPCQCFPPDVQRLPTRLGPLTWLMPPISHKNRSRAPFSAPASPPPHTASAADRRDTSDRPNLPGAPA